jgi:hypothetical protein
MYEGRKLAGFSRTETGTTSERVEVGLKPNHARAQQPATRVVPVPRYSFDARFIM